MKKLLKRLGILAIIGVVLYGVYMLFVIPNGYVSEEEVVQAFFLNINEETVCEDTWSSDTQVICDGLLGQIEELEVEVIDVTKTAQGADVSLMLDGVPINFTVMFETYEPSGLRSFTSDVYYLIKTMN